MNNYRNNMPHYDSLPHNYNPMGMSQQKYSNDKKLRFTNSSPTMPQMPGNMYQTPFIPDTDMPFELDGDMPALPQMPEMPDLTQPGSMPGMPDLTQPGAMPGMPGLIPPWMLPEMQPGMPMMPGMPQTQMPMMPGMPQTQMPMMPGMPQTQMPMMPGMPEMPQTQMPITPGMPPQMPGMPPADGNIYPTMPEMMQPGMMPRINCEQLRELMRRMNCPVNGTPAQPENGTASPMEEDM
ncbi:MAG TPA: hypothetical protein PLF27_07105 [Sedimentibacter sp.]|nr:hypothetical protein [Sedimentibacter sp.]